MGFKETVKEVKKPEVKEVKKPVDGVLVDSKPDYEVRSGEQHIIAKHPIFK